MIVRTVPNAQAELEAIGDCMKQTILASRFVHVRATNA
jgi:hypothetical protein